MTDKLTEPVRFGRYVIEGLIGRGGMARVYLAALEGPEGFAKEVALKIAFPSESSCAEGVHRSLTNEAHIGGLLRHRNMVEMYDFGEVNGQYFIAMEYIKGWPLDVLIGHCRRHKIEIPYTVVLELLIGIANGLCYFHNVKDRDGKAVQPVHRDLKPGNVMVGEKGAVKVMDFGIVSANSNRYKTTAVGTTKGTPTHMAPEQITGGDLDHRTDIFAFGCILYELAMMEKLFCDRTIEALLMKVLNMDVLEQVGLLYRAAPELVVIFDQCVKKDPDDRFYLTSDLVAALQVLWHEAEDGPGLEEWLFTLEPTLPSNTPTPVERIETPQDQLLVVDPSAPLPEDVDEDVWVVPQKAEGGSALHDVPGTRTALAAIRGDRTERGGAQGGILAKLGGPWAAMIAGVGLLFFGAVALFYGETPNSEVVDMPQNETPNLGLESLTVEAQEEPQVPNEVPVTAPTMAPTPRIQRPDPTPPPVATSAKGTVKLNARPPARVEVDGRALEGTTPYLGLELKVGERQIVFICNGGRRVTKTASIVEGSNPTIFVKCQ